MTSKAYNVKIETEDGIIAHLYINATNEHEAAEKAIARRGGKVVEVSEDTELSTAYGANKSIMVKVNA